MSNVPSFESLDHGGVSLDDIHPVLNDDVSGEDIPSELEDDTAVGFLAEELVQSQIASSKEMAGAPPKFVTAVLDAILTAEGPVSYTEICNHAGTDNIEAVKTAALQLIHRNIIFPQQMNREEYVAFHHGGLEAVQRANTKEKIRAAAVEDF